MFFPDSVVFGGLWIVLFLIGCYIVAFVVWSVWYVLHFRVMLWFNLAAVIRLFLSFLYFGCFDVSLASLFFFCFLWGRGFTIGACVRYHVPFSSRGSVFSSSGLDCFFVFFSFGSVVGVLTFYAFVRIGADHRSFFLGVLWRVIFGHFYFGLIRRVATYYRRRIN